MTPTDAGFVGIHRDLSLILTGYVEPNRPRIARELARRLGLTLVDVEREMEARAGDTIANIRAVYGEQRVKALESEIMEQIVLHRRALIRVSGSALVNSHAAPELQRNGVIVCLVASLDSILRRMHLTLGARFHDPAERAKALGDLKREWQARQLPDIVEFDATTISEAVLLERIVEHWRGLALRRG